MADGTPTRRRSTRRLRRTMFLAVALALSAFVIGAWAADVFVDSERDSVDARFSVRGDRSRPATWRWSAIDDVSFHELASSGRSRARSTPRRSTRCARAGARVIAYDVQFTEPTDADGRRRADRGRRARAGNVVLATTEVNEGGETQHLRRRRRAAPARRAAPGDAAVPDRPRRRLRRFAYDVDGLEGFSRGGRRAGQRASRSTADDFAADGTAWIDYHGPPGHDPRPSPSRDVVDGQFDPGTLPRQDRGRRRHRAVAAGRPPDARSRGEEPDVGRRDPGERDLDRAARLPADARRPAGSTSC